MKMNKKILSLLLLFFISNGCTYDKKKEQKIEFEKSKIEFLESEKNKIVTKIDELNEDLKKIKSSIDKLVSYSGTKVLYKSQSKFIFLLTPH